jgi:hypothetical protein
MKPQPSTKPDLAKLQRRLRAEISGQLGFDLQQKLSAADELLIDRASMLKLQLGDFEAALLRGERIDSGTFPEVSERLEAIFRSRLTPSARPNTSRADELRQKLMSMMDAQVEYRIKEGLAAATAEVERLRAELALLRGTPSLETPPAEQTNQPGLP